MKEKRNEPSISYTSPTFLIINIVVFILLFLFLTPKVSARLFPFISNNRLQTFIEESQTAKKIDARKYWEFREFYSPGSFHFNNTGLDQKVISSTINTADISISTNANLVPVLVYESPKLTSVDFLTTHTSINEVFPTTPEVNEEILLQNNNELVYRKDPSTIVIVFLKTPDEMKKANGFFDYRIADKELTEGKYWFNITVITQ